MSIKNNAKLFALQEAVSEAIKDGSLEKKTDVLRLQAGELGIDESGFNELVKQQRDEISRTDRQMKKLSPKKPILYIVCAVLIAVEWTIGLRGDVTFWTIFWLLLINIVTLLVVVFVTSYLLNRK